MRYTFRQLEYFVAAAETGSIVLASERVNISPSSVSTAVAHLEQEFGVQLFARLHAQGLSLTPIGHLLLREAKRLLDQAEWLYTIASEANEQVRGRLVVGCFVTLAPLILPELSHTFTATFPAVKLSHVVGDHESLMGHLRRAEIDVALAYDLGISDEIEFTPLATLPPHVWVGEDHPLAGQAAVTLHELVDLPFVLLDLPVSRDYFLGLFKKEGLVPRISAQSPYQEVVRTMVANGYGYTLANVRPRLGYAPDGRKVVPVALAGQHKPMIVGLATLAQIKKSRLRETFEKHCATTISDVYIPGMIMPLAEQKPGAASA